MQSRYSIQALQQLQLVTHAPIVPLVVVLEQFNVNRLANSCFRGNSSPLAGNFMHWDSFPSFLGDEIVEVELIEEGLEIIEEMTAANETQRRNIHISIDHEKFVGWTSAVSREDLHLSEPLELEQFEPNKNTTAHKVQDHSILAPLTKELTIAFDVQYFNGNWQIIVQTIYPGMDIQLGTDPSNKLVFDPNEIVFFDWEHPGETP